VSRVNDTTSFIFALLGFAAGFAACPFGAVLFGKLDDSVGQAVVAYVSLAYVMFFLGKTLTVNATDINTLSLPRCKHLAAVSVTQAAAFLKCRIGIM